MVLRFGRSGIRSWRRAGALQVCCFSTTTDWKAPVISDPTLMNLFFVNLDGVRVLGVDDEVTIPEVHIELERLVAGCPTCGVVARVQGRSPVRLIDLSMAGRKIALVWNKRRFICLESACEKITWTEVDHRITTSRRESREWPLAFDHFATIAFVRCSTPGSPTGRCSRRSHHAEV